MAVSGLFIRRDMGGAVNMKDAYFCKRYIMFFERGSVKLCASTKTAWCRLILYLRKCDFYNKISIFYDCVLFSTN